MAISKEKKNEIIAQYARHEGDTGSVEVQVAVLTWEINHLNEHIKQHKKDHATYRGFVNNGCSTHQTSDWSLVDWQELSPTDIEYLYDLAEKSDVQLTLFDEKHYFVLGGKPNQIVQNDAKLVFSDLTEISLEDATSGKYRMFQGMFLGTKEQTDDFEQRFAKELCQRFSGVRSQPVIYEAMPLGTTKATALSRLWCYD